MKYYQLALILLLLIVPLVVQGVFHDEPIPLNLDYPSFGKINLETNQGLEDLIAWLYYLIISISGLAAFIMLIWGGIQWMSSAGNPTAIGDAKDRIQKALLGLLLVLSSFIIIQIINPELTVLKSPLPQAGSSPPGVAPKEILSPSTHLTEPVNAGVYLCREETSCLTRYPLGNPTGLFGRKDFISDTFGNWNRQARSITIIGPYDIILYEARDFGGKLICFQGTTNLALHPLKNKTWTENAISAQFFNETSHNICQRPGITVDNINELRDLSPTGVTVDVKASTGSDQPSDGPLFVAKSIGSTLITFRWTSTNADGCSGTDINDRPFSGGANDLITIPTPSSVGIYNFLIECRNATTNESSFDNLKVNVFSL